MAKDRKARALGHLTLQALGVILASIVDTMREAEMEPKTIHHFLDCLDDGFDAVLDGDAYAIMTGLLTVIRLRQRASND